MSERLAYVNGRFIDAQQATLSLEDAGFVWGATVTDRLRTYRGVPFRLADHLARFRRSAEWCCIPLKISDTELETIVRRLLPPEGDKVAILIATPQTLCVHVESLNADRYRPLLQRGARLIVPTTRQLPTDCIPPQAQMRSRLHWWIAEQQVKELDPEASALLLDGGGFITETAFANVLIVRGGMIVSPPRESILPGVSLAVIRELCQGLPIPFEERPIARTEALLADEMLLTSTPFGIAGVSCLDGQAIPWPGPMLQRLVEAWRDRFGVSPHEGIIPAGPMSP